MACTIRKSSSTFLFLIANRLNGNQQFEEAQKWYHYVFDPTSRVQDREILHTEQDRLLGSSGPSRNLGLESLEQMLSNQQALASI